MRRESLMVEESAADRSSTSREAEEILSASSDKAGRSRGQRSNTRRAKRGGGEPDGTFKLTNATN